MKNLYRWLKNNLLLYPEKLIMILLIIGVVIEGFSIASKIVFKSVVKQDFLSNADLSIKMRFPNTPFSEKDYELLLNRIQTTISTHDLHKRNIFMQKTQAAAEQQTITTQQKDTDNDGLPDDWEILYGFNLEDPSDARKDSDKDGYTNLDEFIGGSDPLDPNSFPGELKLKVINIYRKKIQIEFLGYIKLPDNRFQFQINWANRTSFVKLGEKIRAYKIYEFQQDFKKSFNQKMNVEETFDISRLVIKKNEDDPITLVLGNPSFEVERYALMEDLANGTQFEVHSGSIINDYEVLDIEATKVIIIRDQKRYTLSLTKNR
ncbi:MAG: thrombospondin type 3 repeat-containing protein [Chlamydiota bacterium]|nr:thrombospondin type 3 repeat-containing protein [Chlamydiota bacterium]